MEKLKKHEKSVEKESNMHELPMPSNQNDHYDFKVAQFIEENKTLTTGKTVLLGDSLTERITPNLLPQSWKIINRGISGDCVGGWKYQGILDRLEVSVNCLKPTRLVLAIGTNDLIQWHEHLTSVPFDQLLVCYRQLVNQLLADNPQMKLFLQTVPPVRAQISSYNKKIGQLNDFIRELANELNLILIDMNQALSDENGELRRIFSLDGCHLTDTGYAVWVSTLVDFLA